LNTKKYWYCRNDFAMLSHTQPRTEKFWSARPKVVSICFNGPVQARNWGLSKENDGGSGGARNHLRPKHHHAASSKMLSL
jgi:hypothetical protein